jgi:hypothetical protein
MLHQTIASMFGQGYTQITSSFSMPNFTSVSYTPGGNGQAYTHASDIYQAPYSAVAYIDPIPLPGSSLGFLPNHTYQNTSRFNAYDQPEADSFGNETPLQFPFSPQSIDMMSAQATAEPRADPNNLTNQLTTILRESFGIEPKDRGHVYQKSYPNYYDQLSYPRGYRAPEFSKFSREDGKITLEHVGKFILQCGEASTSDALKLRMFPLFLSGTVFT